MKRFLRNLPLGSKIALFTSMVVGASLLTLTLITIQLEQSYSKQELQDQAVLLLDTLPYSIRDELYFVAFDELQDVAKQIGESPNIDRFVIYDRNGAILADSTFSKDVAMMPSQDPDPVGEKLVALEDNEAHINWGEHQFTAGRAVYLNTETIGAVSLTMSTSSLDKKISVLILQSMLLSLAILGSGVVLSFVLSKQISNPLRELMEVSSEMANGETNVRVNIAASDEIGKLGMAFNDMTEAIQMRERDLRDLTASLEQKVEERTEELRQRNEELIQMAISDPLTRIYNRRHFFELAEKEFERAKRYQHSLSLVLADVDHFKKVNDTYGHLFGDQVLTNLAQYLEKNIRNIDVVARYGGEEFIILMPEVGCPDAKIMIERLRQGIVETPLIDSNSKVKLTMSLGISCWDGKEEISFETLLSRADQAMYRSKDKGRNCVSVW